MTVIELEPRVYADLDEDLPAYRAGFTEGYDLGLQAGRLIRPSVPRRILNDLAHCRLDVLCVPLVDAVLFGTLAAVAILFARIVWRTFT